MEIKRFSGESRPEKQNKLKVAERRRGKADRKRGISSEPKGCIARPVIRGSCVCHGRGGGPKSFEKEMRDL